MHILPLTTDLVATFERLTCKVKVELNLRKANHVSVDDTIAIHEAQAKYNELERITKIAIDRVAHPDTFNFLSFLLDEATTGADDVWSGRTNDFRRAHYDGKLAAIKLIHELIKR